MESTGHFTAELRRLVADSYDDCRSCGRKLPLKTAAFAGYATDGSVLYVGGCCKDLINELASHIYWWWEADKRCPHDASLWRYMDFAKFVSMLEHRSIFFARGDLLGDPFEGATGISERRAEWESANLTYFRSAVRSVPNEGEKYTPEYVEEQALYLLKDLSKITEMEPKTHFVSCWHANANESEALWRLYAPPPMTGVAIETNYGRLLSILNQERRIAIGKVQYIDFSKQFAGLYDRMFWKRRSLSHEAEVRAVITDDEAGLISGKNVPVELEKFLLRVVPSPFAAGWFTDLMVTILKKYGLDVPLSRSELLVEPFY